MSRQLTLLRSLGLGDAMMLVVGCIVGSGIFRTASLIAGHVPSPLLTLALWAFGGVLSLCGALCYAELAAMFPATGGDYVYTTRIYGRFWGFLFGWTKLFIERTGTIAILSFVFAEYLSRIVPLSDLAIRALASAAIILLTIVNIAGVRWGTLVQNIFTVLKTVALVALILAAGVALRSPAMAAPDWSLPPLGLDTLSSLGVALVFVLFAYGGWTEAAYVAEEIRHPTRNVPRAIIGGLLLTAALYVLVNWSYLLFIPMADLPNTPLVASAVMQRVLGNAGALFIAAMIACSAFGALNGYILTGARILYAMAKDHALFERLGTIHPLRRTPARALWVNAALASVLVFTKTLDQIMTYSTVVISLFFTLVVFGVFLLRRRLPQAERPYRAWGYPVTPAVFCLTMLGFMADIWIKQPREAMFGFGFLALGLPLYWWSQRQPRPTRIAEPALEDAVAL